MDSIYSRLDIIKDIWYNGTRSCNDTLTLNEKVRCLLIMLYIYDMSVGKKGHVLFALQLALIFIFIAVMGIAITAGDSIIGARDTLVYLLEGYRRWYLTVFYVAIASAAAAVLVNIFVLVATVKTGNFGIQHAWGGVLSIAMVGVMVLAIATGDNLQENAKKAAGDIAALERNELVVTQIDSLSGTGYRTHLPEPRGGNQPYDLRSFQVQGETGRSVEIYVLDNEYEAIRIMVQEAISAQVAYGNEIGNHQGLDTKYMVKHTPNFRIVVDITPVPIGW